MAKAYDFLIQGGVVISGAGIQKGDVGILGERIACVTPQIPAQEAARVVDASGKYVLPGIIDVHAHPVYDDNMKGLSLTAAYGGTTTLIHFAYAKPGTKLVDTLKEYQEDGLRNSYLDFGLHGTLFDAPAQVSEIPQALALGVASFKMFMTYAKLKWMTDDYYLTAAMDLIGEAGGVAIVHAESGLVTDYLEDRSLKRGEDPKKVFLDTRPDYLEAEAVFRAIAIAAVTKCRLYIAHLSTRRALAPLERAREEGQPVYAETCPQYLTLTDDDLQRMGPLAKIGPPLRREHDRTALWEAIQRGSIQVVASDHAPKPKKIGDPFFEAAYGSPQAETMLTVTYDEGINGGRIGVCKLVQLLCENPAMIFGLYPRKGTLQAGADADLVVFDPHLPHTIQHGSLHSRSSYTLYEGRRCLGKPVFSLQRGQVLIEGGEMKRKTGEAGFLSSRMGENPPL